MFESTSRYYNLETAIFITPDDHEIAYKCRRFLPDIRDLTVFIEHTVHGERLDNITARYLGDPEQFWQICDSNRVMNPDDLTAVDGSKIYVSMPTI
jgi:hypothetical protein